jgi:protein unc-45
MSDTSTLENTLEDLLKSLSTNQQNYLTTSDTEILITAFRPSHSGRLQPKAYLTLSAYCHPSSSAPSTSDIVSTFQSKIFSLVDGSNQSDVIAGLGFLVALFQVEAAAASQIFIADGFVEALVDLWDMDPTDSIIEGIARIFGQAAGQKKCRAAVTSDCVAWLGRQARSAFSERVRAAAAVALVKLTQGLSADTTDAPKPTEIPHDEELIVAMQQLLTTTKDRDTMADLVEGLAYSSRKPAVKEALSKDKQFLKTLLGLVPQSKAFTQQQLAGGSTLLFGVVMIILNIVAYRPRLSGEQAQVERLRRMANKGPGASGKLEDQGTDKLDDDAFVRSRGRRLIDAGAHATLAISIRISESKGVRHAAGKALLHLIEEKDNRGKILQVGGAKALMLVIRDVDAQTLSLADLDCIQALAKLAITSSPVQVFGADEGAISDAVRPLSIMLTHPTSNPLQQFESMMALTNLSSHGPSLATRVATAEGLTNKLELLLLEDHELTRRAASELTCNLIAGAEVVFDRYSEASSKLQILVALCDVDDIPTRLATSGALATLTMSPIACTALCELQLEKHRVLPIFAQLVDPSLTPDGANSEVHPGLTHRGIVCLRNLLVGTPSQHRKEMATEAEAAGVVKALVGVVKASQGGGGENSVLLPAAEALKLLLESGIAIQV